MSKTILIVDDYADIRTMMKILIEMAGYKVLEAHDGEQALESARENCPDLILMDIAMPGMNGITAAREIRTFEHCSDTPMIAVTAYGNIYEEEALDAGFNEVIPKPLGFDDIKPLIERYLSAH